MPIKSKIILPVGVLVLGLALALGLVLSRKPLEPSPPKVIPGVVDWTDVTLETYRLTARSQGNVLPMRQVQIIPQINGKIVHMSGNMVNGGFVSKGEVLVRIDPSDYELTVIQAQASVRLAELRLEQEKAEAEVARQEWNDLGEGDPSPLLLREPQLKEAQAALDSARAALAASELNLRRTEIIADFNGRIRSKNVDTGQFVRAGEVLGTYYAVHAFEIALPLPIEDLRYLGIPPVYQVEGSKNGLNVLLESSVTGQPVQWKGKVIRTEGEIDPKSRMVVLVAMVEDPLNQEANTHDQILPIGLFVHGKIEGIEIPSAAKIPRTALREGNKVYIITPDNTLEIRPVEVSKAEKDFVIIAKGLEEGERVCLSILDGATEGMKVQPEGEGKEIPNENEVIP